jgi:glycerophosphoryl diester phosphodiesterase
MTHAQSIGLFQKLGVAMAPELKAQQVAPARSAPQQSQLADQLVQEYRAAGVPPEQLWLQSFEPAIVAHWLNTAGAYAERVVWLDGRYADPAFNHRDEQAIQTAIDRMLALGLQTVAPPMWMLLETEGGVLRPSAYARLSRDAGLRLVTWTVERSGPLADGGGWYYQTLNGNNPLPGSDGQPWLHRDADQLFVLKALFDDVGIAAVFSDWPSTTALVDRCLEQF